MVGVTKWIGLALLLSSCSPGIIGEASDPLPPTHGPGNDGPPRIEETPPKRSFAEPPRIARFFCTPEDGVAPLTVTCSWSVSGPGATCALLGGAATAPQDCATFTRSTQVLDGAGFYTLTLLAEAGGARASQDVLVAVNANRTPVISALGAAPASGVAPFAARLSWAVADPEGDPLRCALDTDGDGVEDQPLTSCAAAADVTVRTTGTLQVTLFVSDSRGAQTQRSVKLTARAAVGDLRVSRTEWGQTVVGPALRLVEGKPALFRVHVLADKPGLSAEVKADAFRGGTLLGALTLAGPSTIPTVEVPEDLSKSFRAVVPAAWITPGLEVRVTVDPSDAVPETDEKNNSVSVTPAVGAGTVLYVTAIPITMGGSTAPVTAFDGPLLQLWPLKEVKSSTRAPYAFSGDLSNGLQGWSQLLGEISTLRASDGSSRYYYGVPGYGGNGIAGLGFIGSPIAVGYLMGTVMAHELGHNFGRNHAPCGTSGDPSYPYPGGKIGSWGYDGASGQLVNPSYSVDLMSYCQPAWVSDHNYAAVQTFLEQRPPESKGGTNLSSPLILVSGTGTSGEVKVKPLHRIHGAVGSAPRPGPFTLRLHTAEGHRDVPFAMDEASEGGLRHFAFTVPDPGPLTRVEILSGGKALAALEARPSKPAAAPSLLHGEASVTVRWDAATHPYALVTHLGLERTTLALWLTGGEATLSTAGLPAGGGFEISVSDGVNAERFELPR